MIERCAAVGDLGGTEVGTKRILNGVFHETLLECNDAEHRIHYSIDDGPSPVSPQEVRNYVGVIKLRPVTLNDATFVEWSSSWESQSEAARDFCHLIYVSLLKSSVMAVLGGLELVILTGFLIGVYKRFCYGAVLAFHTVSTLSPYQQYLSPFEGPHLLFFAAWPMLAGCLMLYLLCDDDILLSLNR